MKAGTPQLTRMGLHKRTCQCSACLRTKLAMYQERVMEMVHVRPPKSDDQLIPVRAHFRKHPSYLSSQTLLLRLVRSYRKSLDRTFEANT